MFSTLPGHMRFALPVLLVVGVTGGLVACGDDSPDTAETTLPAETAPPPTGLSGTEPPAADVPTEESAAELVGLTEDAAEAAAQDLGWTTRVVRRDGEDLAITMDLRENRVNVEVTDGEVTAIVNIG